MFLCCIVFYIIGELCVLNETFRLFFNHCYNSLYVGH